MTTSICSWCWRSSTPVSTRSSTLHVHLRYTLRGVQTYLETADRQEQRCQHCRISCWITPKLHYTDTGYGHRLRTRTSSQQVVDVVQHVVQHLDMLGCAKFLSDSVCTTSCRTVVSSSVDGVRWWCPYSRCPCSGVWHEVIHKQHPGKVDVADGSILLSDVVY